MKKQIQNTTRNLKFEIKDKKTIFTLAAVLSIILLFMFIYTITNWLIQSISYSSYTKQINYYRYNELYTNKKATAHQKVTNIDMFKMIIGSINNTTELSKISLVPDYKNMSEEKMVFETAKVLGLTSNIEEKDLDKRAREIDAIISIVKALENIVGIEVEETTLNIKESRLKKFSDIDKRYISKAITLGMLENKNSAISSKKLIKGKLNKLIMQVVSKYAIVYYKTNDIDINGNVIKNDVYLVTDKKLLPKNDEKYPYIVSNIDKSIYEMEFNIVNEDRFKEPKEIYREMGNLYSQIDETISNYFNVLLNVNYENIDEKDFSNMLGENTLYRLSENDVAEYVRYVKNNKIKLAGKATPQLPIIYNSGEGYFVRTKIEFEVLNSTTEYNLIYGDLTNNIKYNGKNITMYVDVPMGLTFNSNSLLVEVSCNAKNMLNTNENIIVEK